MLQPFRFSFALCLVTRALCGCVPDAAEFPVTSELREQRASIGYALKIDESIASFVDTEHLHRTIQQSVDFFQQEFFPVAVPVNVTVGVSGCLRTGYDFEKKVVQFCKNDRTPKSGTASTDVIHHEMFHALLCQTKPEWCQPGFLKNDDAVALHEAFADLFAYHLNPDEDFGEGFYSDASRVRSYRTSGCYNLLDSTYAKATAMVSVVLGKGNGALQGLRTALLSDDFSHAVLGTESDLCFQEQGPQIDVQPLNYPLSGLSRYRIQRGKPLELNFTVNPVLRQMWPDFRIDWSLDSPLFDVSKSTVSEDAHRFQISACAEEGWSKASAHYWSGTRWLGSKTFYFSVQK